MTVETADDRATFVADFGDEVTWTRAGVPQPAFKAILSRPGEIVDLSVDGGGMLDRQPRLVCREADLPAGAAEDDPVSIETDDGTFAFTCRLVKSDGIGMCVVFLKKA